MARSSLAFLLPILFSVHVQMAAAPEEWNAEQKASGWALQDRDGSFAFYDAPSRQLITWSWEAGTLSQMDLSRAQATPEKWVMDSASNLWFVSGATLNHFDRKGHAGTTLHLPAEVGDLAWDAVSFVLSYRTREPYLEKRDLKTAALLWSYGQKPVKGAVPVTQNLHRIAIKEDGQVLLASGPTLTLTALSGASGKVEATIPFTLEGAATPELDLHGQDRGPLCWWLGNNIAVAAVPASQIPGAKQQGLLLVRLNLTDRKATLQSSDHSEGHILLGVQENKATFRGPSSGLSVLYVQP